ncbi:hypothetical protein [Tianweitania sediminis]|jgi:hypothetical protein|nr:hypothetical protein [Tianweitania sediminis]HEV7417890.1 hypothetical protein [Tianweitania sediminis]
MAIIGDVSPQRKGRLGGFSLSRAAAYTMFAAATGFTAALVFGLI